MPKQKHPFFRPLQAITLLTLALGFWSCQAEKVPPPQKTLEEQVKVQWTWKRTVSGDANFIYGSVKNENDRALKQVVLEFRTQNKQGETLFQRDFTLQDVPARGQKLFSEDYPVRAQEDSGFVVVKKAIPAE